MQAAGPEFEGFRTMTMQGAAVCRALRGGGKGLLAKGGGVSIGGQGKGGYN